MHFSIGCVVSTLFLLSNFGLYALLMFGYPTQWILTAVLPAAGVSIYIVRVHFFRRRDDNIHNNNNNNNQTN